MVAELTGTHDAFIPRGFALRIRPNAARTTQIDVLTAVEVGGRLLPRYLHHYLKGSGKFLNVGNIQSPFDIAPLVTAIGCQGIGQRRIRRQRTTLQGNVVLQEIIRLTITSIHANAGTVRMTVTEFQPLHLILQPAVIEGIDQIQILLRLVAKRCFPIEADGIGFSFHAELTPDTAQFVVRPAVTKPYRRRTMAGWHFIADVIAMLFAIGDETTDIETIPPMADVAPIGQYPIAIAPSGFTAVVLTVEDIHIPVLRRDADGQIAFAAIVAWYQARTDLDSRDILEITYRPLELYTVDYGTGLQAGKRPSRHCLFQDLILIDADFSQYPWGELHRKMTSDSGLCRNIRHRRRIAMNSGIGCQLIQHRI